jgi:hypothetical protein
MTLKQPKIIHNLLAEKEYQELKTYLKNIDKERMSYEDFFGRYVYSDKFIHDFSYKILPIAREFFGDDTILPSYSLFAHYEGEKASLFQHYDDNACTFTVDMCVYQTEPWDLIVDGHNYTLQENEALAYYGEENEHGRGQFPNPEKQHVAMIFFHFVKPDHWFFTHGPEYIDVLRGRK